MYGALDDGKLLAVFHFSDFPHHGASISADVVGQGGQGKGQSEGQGVFGLCFPAVFGSQKQKTEDQLIENIALAKEFQTLGHLNGFPG